MANHLTNETSPYLLQHVENPVDWHPWGEEALSLAKTENKPVLLSIGYASSAQAQGQPHAFSRGIRTQQQVSRTGDTRKAGQRQ